MYPSWAEILFNADPLLIDSDGDTYLDGEEWINFLELERTLNGQLVGRVPLDKWKSDGICGDIPGTPPQDVDHDGIPDLANGRSWINPWNRDCDTFINALDNDDDGDTLPTGPGINSRENSLDEDCLPGTGLRVGDGIPNYLDTDSDGQTMTVAAGSHPNCPSPGSPCSLIEDGRETNYTDFDQDGLADAYDCDDSGPDGDSDLDGISNGVEAALCPHGADTEQCPEDHPFYGFECFLNPDSDCDGVLDCVEAGIPCPSLGSSPATVETDLILIDSDNDGVIDMFDNDDDGDGIPTERELDFACPPGFHGDPSASLTRFPLDPVIPYTFHWYCIEDATGDLGDELLPMTQNTDAPGAFHAPFPLVPDNIPDYLDEDDDGDNRLTLVEGEADDDGDHLVNYLDPYDFDGPNADADGDGILNGIEMDLGLSPYSDDSDGDGISDSQEIGDPTNATDSDGDGLINALDEDDDNDGLLSVDEGTGDLDGDGIPNFLDEDSDGDGELDSDENPGGDATLDSDCDGYANFIDDEDGDGPCAILTGDTGDTDGATPKDCGCSSTSSTFGSMGIWFGALLLGLRRRR